MPHNILLFASGSGSNVEQVVRHFTQVPSVHIRGIFTNNPTAGVVGRGIRLGVPVLVFGRKAEENGSILEHLKDLKPDLIVLAGYLKLIPESWIKTFPGSIINIHPALLPKFGGKGMYGMHVHHAVVESGERESGITIHYVNSRYDEGAIIRQVSVELDPGDTAVDVQRKVQVLEHQYYPLVIEKLLLDAES